MDTILQSQRGCGGVLFPLFSGFFVGIVEFIVMAKARVTQESAEGAAQDIELVAIDRQ